MRQLSVLPGESSFFVEIPKGIRFIVHSRIFTEEEMLNLEPVEPCE